MFTGLVQVVATVRAVQHAGSSSVVSLVLAALAGEVAVGDSVMVDGACLTARAVRGEAAEFDVSAETLRRTTLGRLGAGDRVNVELAMRPTDRFGGHFVSGHVDGLGTVISNRRLPGETSLRVRTAPELAAMMIMKGSVAVDGVSLTIAGLEGDAFEVSLIPHTLAATTLERKVAGDAVNIECDMIGKWVRGFVEAAQRRGGLTMEKLQEGGY